MVYIVEMVAGRDDQKSVFNAGMYNVKISYILKTGTIMYLTF